MYVTFQSSKKANSKPKKRFGLVEADQQLKLFAKNKKTESMIVTIFDDEDFYFRSDFQAGTDKTSNLLLLVEDLLETEFSDVEEADKTALLQRIVSEFKLEGQKNVEETHEKPKPSPNRKRKMIPKKKDKIDATKRPPNFLKLGAFFFSLKGFVAVMILFLLILGSYILFLPSDSTSTEVATYSEFVQSGAYEEALTHYPEKENQLVETLYTKQDEKGLNLLVTRKKSSLAAFYLAFLQEKWTKVTSIQDIPLSSTIQEMRGYAFLQQGKLEEAELINQELKNETLTNQIKESKKQQAYEALREQKITVAESINQEIKDDELSEDIKVAKSIVNLLSKYKADKENKKLSEKERKEADENFRLWTGNLQKLGGIEE